MALVKISTDGKEFEVKDDIARDDRRLREALTPFYPEMANAEITRTENDGKLVVEMAKRAGTKGCCADVLTALKNAPEQINPALEMQHKLKQLEKQDKLDLRTILRLQPQIRRAASDGAEQLEQHKKALALLCDVMPMPARTVPGGF
jgi:nitrate reductase NapAB chaperone NapD